MTRRARAKNFAAAWYVRLGLEYAPRTDVDIGLSRRWLARRCARGNEPTNGTGNLWSDIDVCSTRGRRFVLADGPVPDWPRYNCARTAHTPTLFSVRE